MVLKKAGSYSGNGTAAARQAEKCLCARFAFRNVRSRFFSAVFAALAVLAAFCVLSFAAGCVRREVHSDAGITELETLTRLGIVDPKNVPEPDAEVTAYGLADALERLAGAGDHYRAADYFRNFTLNYDVDFYRAPSGLILEPEAEISAAELYSACLQVLGYDPFAAYAGSVETGGTAGREEAVLELAKSAGFGYFSEVQAGKTVNYRKLALTLYELLLLRTEGSERTVYMWLGDLDSGFRSLLVNNGLYDELPTELVPRINGGMYLPGTFLAAVKSGAGSEWQASYVNVSGSQLTAYFALLEADGWTLETRLEQSSEPAALIYLYYKAYAAGTDGEMGLTVKYSADGTLNWYLMA